MQTWAPHVTVATVIEHNGRFLLVQERDKTTGAMVFNQPAGHLEAGESITAAALRETLEETGWEVELTGVLGVALYTAAANGVTYYRTTLVGKPLRELEGATLDPDIHATHWLDYQEILTSAADMRSSMVISDIERYRSGKIYPIDLIQYY